MQGHPGSRNQDTNPGLPGSNVPDAVGPSEKSWEKLPGWRYREVVVVCVGGGVSGVGKGSRVPSQPGGQS